MNDDLVSVLVPVYNGEKYVVEFLESVKRQTYKNIQLVIVDDASKDSSFMKCQEWVELNNNQFTLCQLYSNRKNLGLTANMNVLASYAKGKYLFLADQDDVWLDDKIEKMVDYMENHPECSLCVSDRSIVDEKLDVKVESEFSLKKYHIDSMCFEEFIMHTNVGCSANKMCIRNTENNIFPIPVDIIEHDRLIAILSSYNGSIDYFFAPLVLYRIHSKNLSQNYCRQFARGKLDFFVRLCKQEKRRKQIEKHDFQIIKNELLCRYGVDLNTINHRLIRNRKKENAIISVFRETLAHIRVGDIGEWRG